VRSIYYIVGSKGVGGENVAVDYVIDSNRQCAVEDMKLREKFAEWEDEDEDEREDVDNVEAEQEDSY
jgi:hypothetical protein